MSAEWLFGLSTTIVQAEIFSQLFEADIQGRLGINLKVFGGPLTTTTSSDRSNIILLEILLEIYSVIVILSKKKKTLKL